MSLAQPIAFGVANGSKITHYTFKHWSYVRSRWCHRRCPL